MAASALPLTARACRLVARFARRGLGV